MFSMCSELTPRARILDTRIPQLMQPWSRCKQGEHLLMFTFRAGVEPGDLLTLVNEWKVLKICHRLFAVLSHSKY